MAIKFLNDVDVDGELTTSGGTNNITTTNASSSLYLLNLTRTSTSLTTAGNVGIGTTSPSQRLHVSGNIRAETGGSTPDNTTSTYEKGITLTGGNMRLVIDTSNVINGGSYIQTRHSSTSYPHVYYNLALNPLGGNVGIGTSSPSAKLHVKESTSATYAAYIENTIAGGDYLAMIGDAGDNVFEFLSSGTGGEAEMKMYSDGVLKADINADGNSYFNGGNVGIGTTAPAEKLEVAGKIKATGTADVLQLYRNSSSQANYIKFYDNATSSSEFYLGYTSNNKDFQISNLASSGTISLRSGGASTMTLNSSQNVGIGTTAPTQKLDVNGNMVFSQRLVANSNQYYVKLGVWSYASTYGIGMTNGFTYGALNNDYAMTFCMNNDSDRGWWWGYDGQSKSTGAMSCNMQGKLKINHSIGLGTVNPSATQGRIDASNDIVAYSTSDIRLKNNIKSIDKALDKVNSIQGIEFDWIEKEEVHGNSGHDIGVIAQEVEKILPDVVTTRDNGYKAVKYEKIVPLLIEAIKDLSKQVDGLKRLI